MSWRGSFFCITMIVCLLGLASPGKVYAVETTAETVEETEAPTTEDVDTDSWAGKIWQSAIDMVKDYFLGPSYDNRPDIGSIKALEPYSLLGDISFPDGEAMDEVKGISASFYKLVSAISLVGLVLSFVIGGISIAISRAKNKSEVQSAILIKVAVFTAIFSITGIWSILIPLLKLASGG